MVNLIRKLRFNARRCGESEIRPKWAELLLAKLCLCFLAKKNNSCRWAADEGFLF